jgi:putative ubiquitin-RnfH superfamily antitoxin RatB of RatAB toxin-antitoxin module
VSIRVTVAFAAPGLVSTQDGFADVNTKSGEVSISLPLNATIADALIKAGFDSTRITAVGVWGKVRPLTFVLRDNDRVEIYRPLQSDPKAARRARDNGSTQKKRKA